MEARRLPLGAVAKDDGSVVVPESRRADGSVRKEIRIRKGYVPQDEQPVYRPRGRREPSTRAPPASAVSDLTAGIGSISLANEEKASPEAKRDDEEEEKPAPTSLQQRARQLPIGAVETASGDVIIPSSQRPDGTFRKEIKVRKGYVPQDEQPMYRPRALRNAETSQPMRTTDTLTHDQTPPAPAGSMGTQSPSSNPPASTPPPPSSTVHPNRRRHIEL
ncbi:hypothetical protein SPRG_06287 [Saprolegnia parasitica CBS 223.65]|uniref:WIBG Mago-binding domain-containing protein n=1 Tax=Saprolegnia parasitica (strain CBS 223.65) TaxID=695850 RepID=A0A067CCP7_SAPPC|nr:hypothetical protein SPRG_06287 [Saprolegnia parasitica CBS 223.65]KDO28238.1 hypothetical protein SPRG_06287 [Saprolegnia parasitica CBS 223.65]|eukprot:XP_012201062.1 hypothetical protein SPRG_06287 [Saprolegnia parasitica CBS 223.65]